MSGGVILTTAADGQDRAVTASAQVPSAPAPAVPAPLPATLSVTPPPAARGINPAAPVQIAAMTGTITDVKMVNDSGKAIPGVLTPDGKAWKPTNQLGYGRTYTMTVSALGPTGMPSRQASSFTTVSPSNQTEVDFETTSGGLLKDGGTYGIGTVLVAHFDEPISNKANAERHLIVTTTPPVVGSWY